MSDLNEYQKICNFTITQFISNQISNHKRVDKQDDSSTEKNEIKNENNHQQTKAKVNCMNTN